MVSNRSEAEGERFLGRAVVQAGPSGGGLPRRAVPWVARPTLDGESASAVG